MENSTPSLRSEISADEEARLRAEISSLRAQLDERLSSESAQELERSQKQVLDVLESMGDGFIELDKDYTVLRVNKNQERISGLDRHQTVGKNHWDVWPKETIPKIWEAYRKAIQENAPVRVDDFNTALKIWMTVDAYPTPKGGIAAFFRDVTEQKNALSTIESQRERFSRLAAASGIGLWYCDLPFSDLIWDNIVKEHFWLSSDDHITIDTFYERIHPQDRERTRAAIETSMQSHTRYDVEYRTTRPGNETEIKWIRSIGWTDYNSLGKPTRFDGITLDVTPRKIAEAKLKEGESQFRILVNSIPQLLWTAAADGEVCDYLSPQWDEYTGVPAPDQLKMQWVVSTIHPEDRARVWDYWSGAVRDEHDYDIEYRIRRHDGEYRWFKTRAIPLRNENGSILSWFGTCTDIHDTKEAEAKLALERSQLETIFQKSPAAMVLWRGPDLIFDKINPGYQAIFSDRELLGKPFTEALPETKGQPFEQWIKHVFETGETIVQPEMLAKLVLYSGGPVEDRYFDMHFERVMGAENQPYGVYEHAVDVTDRVLSRRELEKSKAELEFARQELESFLTQAPIGVAILSGPNHIYTFINPMFMSMLFGGRPVNDLLKKTVRQALPELEGQGFHEILDEVYRTGKPFIGAKIRVSVIQNNGLEKEMFINFTYQAKRNSSGKIDGILAVVYEVTDQVNEQKEIELLADNLRTAIISRDTFLGIASHELNTPLTSLKMQTQMSKRILQRQGAEAMTAERLHKLLDNNLIQTERLGRLVNDMLDVSRVDSGKLAISKTQADLSKLVENVLEIFNPQLEAAGCELSTQITQNIWANIDSSRIEQVLTNLITNAIKYAPGKKVEVKAERANGMAKITLGDNGHGIASENQERIFGRFERATSASDVTGLGLGLYICRQIVQDHGGKIYVESELGHGSSFIFELPIENG